MSYTDDGVLAKLSALNETQESIVTVAQWVMFHKYVRNSLDPDSVVLGHRLQSRSGLNGH